MQHLPEIDRTLAHAEAPIAMSMEQPDPISELFQRLGRSIDFRPGEIVFRQHEPCQGLYMLCTGVFMRVAERRHSSLNLGQIGGGELVELAAALGDGRHTCTLTAKTAASALLLPIKELGEAFQRHPWLRMQLLGALAREVSRAYNFCAMNRPGRGRRVNGRTGR